ncbi:hypothetical protein [Xenorhabdus lircayensis]|uniref:Uncharacterized protein n=1 Tax=Xenorhabdus lircayensis TaxID=2763499 RepID=A0ABS0UA23_9GAMM|nr:hypothetical protein [Xenorhabdus lircayensis]MBI6550739.1 hypothetical protein [Xenorhabdus lircayensis]
MADNYHAANICRLILLSYNFLLSMHNYPLAGNFLSPENGHPIPPCYTLIIFADKRCQTRKSSFFFDEKTSFNAFANILYPENYISVAIDNNVPKPRQYKY